MSPRHFDPTGMMYDASKGRSCLALFDAAALAAGPLCKLWLKEVIPHGLHGCWSPTSYWGEHASAAGAPAQTAIAHARSDAGAPETRRE